MFENDFDNIFQEEEEYTSLKDVRKLCEELVFYHLDKEFEYGYVKDGKFKKHPSQKDIIKYHKLLSPEDFEKYGGGTCFDYVEYEQKWLSDKGVDCRKIWISEEMPMDQTEHTFVMIECENQFIWVEPVLKKFKGVHVFSNKRDLFKTAAYWVFMNAKNPEHMDGVKYTVFDYTNSAIKYNTKVEDAVSYILGNAKWLFDDMVKESKGKVVEEAYRHSMYDRDDPKTEQKKMIKLYQNIIFLKDYSNLKKMTKTECIDYLCETYNILAEIYDTIEEDYDEKPVKTSRLGFAKKPKNNGKHRKDIDRLIWEIRSNIIELNRSWSREGAKTIVGKMLDVFEYEQRELNQTAPVFNKLLGNSVAKISNKVIGSIHESYCDFDMMELDDMIQEAKLSTDDRNDLDDSQFGIPELRKYPLTDKKHVLQAVRFFNKAPAEYKEELAKNIVKRAKELGMDWENWESLKPYLDKKVQEADQPNRHTIEKVKDFPFDKVYFGMDKNVGDHMDLDRPLFVTPYKGLASIFAASRNPKVNEYLRGSGYDNRGYEEWSWDRDKLKDYLKEVHMLAEGAPDLKPTTIDCVGYVYEIDMKDVEGYIGKYPWMDQHDREYLICGQDEIKFKPQEVHVKMHIKGVPSKRKVVQEAAQHKPMYFYHMIDRSVKLDDKGLKTPDYVLTKEHDEDLYLKMTEKYRYRLTHGWNIYPDKKPEELTSDQIYDGINQFRKSKRGNNQIYMFRYPPYKELGPHMADLLKDKEIYAFDINDPNNQKYINAIDWGWDGSNTDNKKLHRQWYENISKEDYFKKYDDNGKPLFAPLNHISIDPSKGFLPLSCLQKSSEVIQETYHSYQEAVDINSLRQQCQEVFQQASQIHYGCLDENGERITASPFKDSWKMISTYHSQSIQSMEQSKLGVCFEHSFYVAKLLKDRGLPCQTFFLNCNIDHTQPSEEDEDTNIQQESESIAVEQHNNNDMSFWHQFTIVPNDVDSIVLIETSLTHDKNGVFLVANMEDLVSHLIQTFDLNLPQEDLEIMKQDLIDVSNFTPRDGDTYIGYIDQAYLNGKFIKNEIRINHQTKTMKTYWQYLSDNQYLSEDGMKINEQIQQMDDNTAFDIINLLNAAPLFTDEGWEFHKSFFNNDKIHMSVSEMESALKGFVQESYMGIKHNTLKEKFQYIPLTKQSIKKYAPQGDFQHGMERIHVTKDTKGAIYINKNHVVVGYVVVTKKSNGERWITALEVSNEYKDNGYDTDLLQIAVDDFEAEYLSINPDQSQTLPMYQKFGFKVIEKTESMIVLKLNKTEGIDKT
jgi:ribosomal protein S18 acetylase RimI-like enzyme